jgi:hypothetical protein
MSMIESILVALVVGGAALYLLRRAWRRLARPGGGCCGRCPMAGPKIRLAAPPERVSSDSLT